MYKFSYKEVEIDDLIVMFKIKEIQLFNDAVCDLLADGHSEGGIKYAMTKPDVQRRIKMNDNENLAQVFKIDVDRYAFKIKDDRWDDKNQKSAEKEIAKKIASELRANDQVISVKPGDTNGFVYFIQAENGGPIKIGYSIKPEKRLTDLQVAHPYKLSLIGTIHGNMFIEKKLHRYLLHARTYGEWFEPDEIVLATIKSCLEIGYEYVKTLK